jgi:TDG/mug DNA glycosylase family protein
MTAPHLTVHLEPHDLSPELPVSLARLHWKLSVGDRLVLDVADRSWPPERLVDLLVGAGFDPGRPRTVRPAGRRPGRRLAVRRLRTLPDTVGPGMRVLVCGLNPSLVASDAGYGYAGRNNRFWPAALAAGLVTVARDPLHALLAEGVGMTDLVKRATPGASVLSGDEYRLGLARVRRLVEWLVPDRMLFVGLAGWRAAVDRSAAPGWQPRGDRAGGTPLSVPAYVMPSTSGLNARTSLAELATHMEVALGPPPVA